MPNQSNLQNGDNMEQSVKKSAFDDETRKSNAFESFSVATAADIGLKSLVAATCGVILYKQLKSDS